MSSTAELYGAVGAANGAQRSFVFEPQYSVVELDAQRWLLPDGCLDLDNAVLAMRAADPHFGTTDTILVTAQPYSELGAEPAEWNGIPLSGFHYEADVVGDGKVSLISTHLWRLLPPRPEVPGFGVAGTRNTMPFLLLHLAMAALDRLVDTEAHMETLGCPNDYCDNVADIDAFFVSGRWFCDQLCNPVLRHAVAEGRISLDQFDSIKRILNRAHCRPPNDGHHSCLIVYGQPDARFATKLHEDLRARDVECWIYHKNARIGALTWSDIHQQIRSMDRVLVVCSAAGLARPGLQRELELIDTSARDKIIPVSRDDKWMAPSHTVSRGFGNLVVQLRERTYVDFSTPGAYEGSLDRLVDALRWE